MSELNNELVPVQAGGEVAVNDMAGLLAQMAADAGQGLENVTADDMAIPFIKLLQSNHPMVKEEEAAYIPGAKAGMLYNTVTGEVIDIRAKEGKFIMAIPCHFDKLVVEWKPNNGGIVARHPMNKALVENPAGGRDEKGKPLSADGNTLEETAYHFVLLQKADGNMEWGIMALKSTQLTPSKKWVNLMQNAKLTLPNGQKLKAPSFAFAYKVTSFLDENKKAQKYMNYRFEQGGQVVDPAIYSAAKSFRDAVTTGKAKMADEAGVDGHAADAGGTSDDDTPF